MKFKLAIFAVAILAAVMFSGLLTSMIPQHVHADAMNAENLIFTFIDSSDTNAAGDSTLAIGAITTADEIRFALMWDKSGTGPDTVISIFPYTDSLTIGAGIVTPATFTYGDDYLIVWRDLNP